MAKNKATKAKKTPFWKKGWFWAVVIVLGLIGSATAGGSESAGTDTQDPVEVTEAIEETPSVYTITGGETGEYGRVVTLNKDTDMPVSCYLYKLPAGTYEVTTTFNGMAAFAVVKDATTIEEGNSEYPEVLDYVSDGQLLLTAGDNDFNGHANKEVVVTVAEDESISIPADGVTFNFEVQ